MGHKGKRAVSGKRAKRRSRVAARSAERGSAKKRSTKQKRARTPAAKEWTLPSLEQVIPAVLALSKQSTLAIGAEELVAEYARNIDSLLPGRSICIRVLNPYTLETTSVQAKKRLLPGVGAAPLGLHPSAVANRGLGELRKHSRIRISSTYRPLFRDVCRGGICIPLAARGTLYGLLNVEYPAPGPTPRGLLRKDEELLMPLAHQLSIALQNHALAKQTVHLQDFQAKLIEEAGALILAVDREGRVTVFNRALASLTGFEQGSVLGRDLRTWLAKQGRLDLAAMILQGLTGSAQHTIDARLPSQSGTDIRAAFQLAAIPGADGNIDSVVAIGHDTTRLKALEHQIVQSEKLATLGEIAAGVVHEINNPLTSIMAYADYLLRKLERDGTDPADVDRMRKIVEGAERILRFSRDLVVYARPSGEEFDAVSLNEVVAQSLSFCEHILKKAGAHVELRLGELPPIYGIKAQLQQVVINLVTNASHAVSQKGGSILIETRARGDRAAMLEVRDDGIGITPENLSHIFEPFFTTKTEGNGTGLGLSIAKNIVERHGGRVEVRSAVHRGTTFSIFLPTGSRGSMDQKTES